jgi:hypothetical protein
LKILLTTFTKPATWKHSLKRKEEREIEAFITSTLKWLPNFLFNVIWLIPFWEMESTVLTAEVTSSMK